MGSRPPMSQELDIQLKRAYDATSADDGLRYLVDRIWPRGVTKADAQLEAWLKHIAPSDELRKWFGHDPERWDEFHRRYTTELKTHHDDLTQLAERARQQRITLVFGARDELHNQAVVIRDYLIAHLQTD